MDVARRVGGAILDGKPVGALDRLLYRLGDLLVYGPLRNVLGMSRVRVAYTAGEAIGPDLFVFYRSHRHQPEAALRLDRDQRVRLHPAQRPGEVRHRRARRWRASSSSSRPSANC